MPVVTSTDRPKSVGNLCVIEVFGGDFSAVSLLFGFSLGVGTFVTGVRSLPFTLTIWTICSFRLPNPHQ